MCQTVLVADALCPALILFFFMSASMVASSIICGRISPVLIIAHCKLSARERYGNNCAHYIQILAFWGTINPVPRNSRVWLESTGSISRPVYYTISLLRSNFRGSLVRQDHVSNSSAVVLQFVLDCMRRS